MTTGLQRKQPVVAIFKNNNSIGSLLLRSNYYFNKTLDPDSLHHVGPGHPHCNFPDPALGCDGDRGEDSHV